VARWTWYEWLGVAAPLALFWAFHRIAKQSRNTGALSAVSWRLLCFGAFQMTLAVAIMLPPQLERLRPFEPMRYLQLLYIFLFLLGGGLIGKYVLGAHPWRWAMLFVPLSCGMIFAQLRMYPATQHLELPGVESRNEWVRAFTWIRDSTPPESLFALDPRYMEMRGEDFHGFRALAARSVLADNLKDPGMAARVPRLAPRWQSESTALSNWRNFQIEDFRRLKNRFGVGWVVVTRPGVAGLSCPWMDSAVLVCRID
jgi:hypothetical protein